MMKTYFKPVWLFVLAFGIADQGLAQTQANPTPLATPLTSAPNPHANPRASLHASLHDKIATAYDADEATDPRLALANITPLMDEALADLALDADDFAKVSILFASALYENNRPADAAIALKSALDRLQAAGLGQSRRSAQLLLNYAIFKGAAGDPEAGIEIKTQALELYQKLDGPLSAKTGSIKASIAFSYFSLGRVAEAAAYYKSALSIIVPDANNAYSYSSQLGNYSVALRLMGDDEGALAASQKAVFVAETYLPTGHRALSWAYTNLAATLVDMGRFAEADAIYTKALDGVAKSLGKSSFEAGAFSYYLALSKTHQGQFETATALLTNAVAIITANPNASNPDILGLVHLELGNIAYKQAHFNEAKTQILHGIAIAEPLKDKGVSTLALLRYSLAKTLFLQADYQGSLSQIKLASSYFNAQLPVNANLRIEAEMLRALILNRQDQSSEALTFALPVFETMQTRLFSDGVSRQERLDMSRSFQLNFARFADIAIDNNRPDLAFRALQLASFSEVASTSQGMAARIATSNPKAALLARSIQDAQEKRQTLSRERSFALGKSPKQVERLDAAIASIDKNLSQFSQNIKRIFPQYEKLSHPQPVTLNEAQAQLSQGEAVIMPSLSDDRLTSFVLTSDGLVWDRAPLSLSAANLAIHSIRSSIDNSQARQADTAFTDSGFDRQSAHLLGRSVFTPKLLSALNNVNDLSLMGSGPIMTLPLGLLITQAPSGLDTDDKALRATHFVIKRFAVSVKPSFIIATQSSSKKTSAKKTSERKASGFLGFGDPILGPVDSGYFRGSKNSLLKFTPWRGGLADIDSLKSMPSLPQTKTELLAMQKALGLPRSLVFLGAEATETRLKSMPLESYSVIAFATHGLISGDLQNLHEPALVMTPPASPSLNDDGLLTASDIAGLHLKAAWVILSACNTGSGLEDGAAGYSGLTRAFMQAGAQNLLVSLWPVRDDVAGLLSVGTLKLRTTGLSSPQALRQTMLKLMNDESVAHSADPAVWAPFSLVIR